MSFVTCTKCAVFMASNPTIRDIFQLEKAKKRFILLLCPNQTSSVCPLVHYIYDVEKAVN